MNVFLRYDTFLLATVKCFQQRFTFGE